MSNSPISDLRSRMIADMTVRSFGDKTKHDYIRHVEAFAKFLGRSPDTTTADDIRRFQLMQVQQGAQPPKMNTQASALRFFFTITLGRADLAHQLARTHYPRKLPRVLTPDQVAHLLEAAPLGQRFTLWTTEIWTRLVTAGMSADAVAGELW